MSSEADRELGVRLCLDDADLVRYKEDATRLHDEGKLGWPNIFLSLDSARGFASRWLGKLPDLRLLGLVLPTAYRSELLAATSTKPGQGALGLHQAVQRNQRPEEGGMTVGYDVLGLEVGGTFHSFICYHLTGDLIDTLELKLNQRGLLDDLADAKVAVEFANMQQTGVGEGSWFPWRIDQFPLA